MRVVPVLKMKGNEINDVESNRNETYYNKTLHKLEQNDPTMTHLHIGSSYANREWRRYIPRTPYNYFRLGAGIGKNTLLNLYMLIFIILQ